MLSGTTFITATAPAGALTGSVTVTTGTTTLTSAKTFKVLPTIAVGTDGFQHGEPEELLLWNAAFEFFNAPPDRVESTKKFSWECFFYKLRVNASRTIPAIRINALLEFAPLFPKSRAAARLRLHARRQRPGPSRPPYAIQGADKHHGMIIVVSSPNIGPGDWKSTSQ